MGLFAVAPRASATEWFVQPGSSGIGTSSAPFGKIQNAIDVAQPGDVVSVRPGTYPEPLRSVRPGRLEKPITIRAVKGRGSVVVSVPAQVLSVSHAYLVVESLVFDAQYAQADAVSVSSAGSFFVLRDSEVRRTTRDAIDMRSPEGVLIERSLIHHALNARNGRTDAHGIVAGAARRLTIRDTEIHTFSGDAIQLDPDRSAPGWDDVLIERCRLWLAPLPEPENGFAAGVVPGENAVDTKASSGLPRAKIVIRDTEAWGFRDGFIGNMAAFNLKEHIDATVDGVTVRDSEIAFRVRGTTGRVTGAWVLVKNAVVHSSEIAFRYENALENFRVWNTTIGGGLRRIFRAASASSSEPHVRNLLVYGGALPPEASHPSNRAVRRDAFVNAATHNYQLSPTSSAIDAGVTLSEVTADRQGTLRPQGAGYDIGAYEAAKPAGRSGEIAALALKTARYGCR
jgi:hypothetical protein